MSKKDKWKILRHEGPVFTPEYEHKNHKVEVAGSSYTFPPMAEEMLYHWAAKLETEYVEDKVFQKNFFKDLKPLIPSTLKFTKFPQDWDLWPIHRFIQQKKLDKAARPKEEKKQEIAARLAIKEKYGIALLDGKEVSLGNYTVEPPGIFMGRGKHPLRGSWKPRIKPEDITLNLDKKAPVPTPPEGHKWNKVVENKNAFWTLMWIERVTGAQKRVLFAANSFVKQDADKKKFVKAIELAKRFDEVNAFIEKKLSSKDSWTRELATVSHLISLLSIRVGDEKGEDTADTYGASSLQFEHVKIEDGRVVLDFLGKDSIRYFNRCSLHEDAVKNIEKVLEGKKKGDKLFPRTTSGEIKTFLGIVMPGLTAKQFRTATGSTLLAEELKKSTVTKNDKPSKKLEAFNKANLEIAKKLNHHTAVSEAYDSSLANMKMKLVDTKGRLKAVKGEAEEEILKAKKKKDESVKFARKRYKGAKLVEALARVKRTYKNKKEIWDKRVDRLQERYDNLKSKVKMKQDTKGIALGTSKTNYADPRIIVSWARDKDLDIGKIYPKTAQDKFAWSLDTKKSFYKNYPEV